MTAKEKTALLNRLTRLAHEIGGMDTVGPHAVHQLANHVDTLIDVLALAVREIHTEPEAQS